MFRSLNTAASGMIAQQLNLDNIANNLANASTAGFSQASFAVPGSSLSEPGDAWRRFHAADDLLHWTADRTGRTVVGVGDGSDARRFRTDRQPARSGDSGPGLFPSPAAQRGIGLHALRQFSGGRAGKRRDV